ncbi:PAS domain-containing sensor histidine kinase [Hufsiella ginkgonis]|nr:PAS domain-containing sensor histidine kinase [Hufsiella ginkgonis]
MGQLTREFDWAGTTLGSPTTWPQSLRTTLSILLNSRFPMFLFWGPEQIGFYNDAYRPSLGIDGKHPKILGMPGAEAWPDIWHIIKPLIDGVLAGEEATWSEDQLIPIERNGNLEDVYWTFSYSPVRTESGSIEGVFVTCSETTSRVNMLRELKESNYTQQQLNGDLQHSLRATQLSEARFRNLVEQAPVAIAILEGRSLVIREVNEMILQIWGRDHSVVGKPIHLALPEIQGQPFLALLDHVYISGIPYYGNEAKVLLEQQGELKELYVNFAYKPVKDTDDTTHSIMVIAIDVTEQVEARKAIDEVNARLTIAMEAAALGSTEVEFATGKMQATAQFKKNYGRNPEEDFTYAQLFESIMPEYRQEIKHRVAAAVKNRTVYQAEYEVRWPDGTLHWIAAYGKARYDDEGVARRIVGMTADITDRKTFERRKDDFLSIASHELKTPLTSLKAVLQFLNLIKDQPFTKRHVQLIEQANRSMDKMGRLMDDLLHVNRISEGQLQLQKTWFNSARMLEGCCSSVGLNADEECAVTGDLDLELYADEQRLGQVVINFITNAVKYAPGSPISISIENLGDQVKITVADNGPGIPEEAKSQIFDRYFRASHSSNEYTGLGLGLYISAEIVKRHNGRIGVHSEPGKGSSFWFTLPLEDRSKR